VASGAVRRHGYLQTRQRRVPQDAAISDPARFVQITGEPWFTTGVWKYVRDQQSVFESGTATGADRFNLARGGVARYATSLMVSGGVVGATKPIVADLPTSSSEDPDRRNGDRRGIRCEAYNA
jgi:hypothetical protein